MLRKKIKIYKEFFDQKISLPQKEKFFNNFLKISAGTVILILFLFFITLLFGSAAAGKEFGFKFFTGSNWNPVFGEYGALPFIAGTLVTSFLAIMISFPFALSIALFLGEYFRIGLATAFLKSAIELLAGIPSVIYGFWGIFVLVPLIRKMQFFLGVVPYGVGIFTAALILAVMIVPYAASLSREMIQLVPHDLKEAALSLGATKYEMIKLVVLPYARSGIIAGVLLSLGRALGETMAVTMVIGNRNQLPQSLFDPANTIASVIANDFAEATSTLFVSSLIQLALILFLITFFINLLGRIIINKTKVEFA